MPTLEQAQSALEQYFNFSRFREGQADVIQAVLDAKDVIVVMPTGGGKSLCYQLPALLFPGVTIVISPLIALMKDQVDALIARDIDATFINSSLGIEEQRARVRAMQAGEYKLVYIAPERFRNTHFVEAMRRVNVSLFAVDEAHCVSQWGHDFRPDYLRLKEAVARLGEDGQRPPVIALTATATPAVRDDIAKQLGLQKTASFIAGFDRHNLYLRVVPCGNEKERAKRAEQTVRDAGGTGIIYAATRKAVEDVSGRLQAAGLRVMGYHAGLNDQTRARIQDRFMASELQAIVATNAFGMGIDKSDIRFVTHYNVPGSIEAYYQEVGRAGRDGLPSVCTLLFNYVDRRVHDFFIEGNHPSAYTVQRVWQCLTSFGQEAVRLPAREIASRIGLRNDMSIGAALILLEKAGHLQRLSGYDEQSPAGVRLLDRVGPAELRVDWGEQTRRQQLEETKLRTMFDFAYHEKCLRKFILRYFGERREITGCRCSNCQPKFRPARVNPQTASGEPQTASGELVITTPERPKPVAETVDVSAVAEPMGPRPLTDAEHLTMRKILSCIARVDGQYGKGTIAAVLRGSKAKNILDHQLNELSTWGLLGEYSQDELTRFINALIVASCVRQSGSARPVVSLTTLGREVMHNRARVELDLEGVEADTSDDLDALEISPARGATHEETMELYRQGLGIAGIAAKRNLKTSTIETHLADLLEQGRDIRVSDFVPDADREFIEAAAREHGLERLGPIKEVVPEHISYGQIRLVLAVLRRQTTLTPKP
ncbi:MAG: RecQ family ATP-dependent DNA helicase [Blastocatellia bacterium]